MPYKPTGRPNGRPPSLPRNLGELAMRDFVSRMDPHTGLVLPDLSRFALSLHVSRSSLKNVVRRLRDRGLLELVFIKQTPDAKIAAIYYRVKVRGKPPAICQRCAFRNASGTQSPRLRCPFAHP